MKSFYNITLIIFYFLIFLIKSQPKNDNIIDLDLTFHDTGRKSQTIILNDYNFDSLVQNGNLNRWLVIFFSETSSFCKQIKSIIDKIIEEKKYKKINNIKFGSMDIDNNLQSLIRFNITGVPYIIIVENNKMTQFQMFPIEQNIINFIETEIDEFIDMKDFIEQLSLFEFIRDLSIFTLRYYVEKINSAEISRILRFKIMKNLNYIQRKFWYEEDKIFSDVNEVSACFLHPEGEYSHLNLKMTKEEKTEFVRSELTKLQGKILPYIYLPTNPTYRLSNILPKSAVTLQSAKKVPFIVSFEAVEYPGPDKEKSINNMTVLDFIEFEFESMKKHFNPLIVSFIHSFRNKNEKLSLIVPSNNHNKFNQQFLDEEEIENRSFNNFNNDKESDDLSLSDIDINDEGNINNDTAQEKDNPQNLYIPILEPRAFRENKSYLNDAMDKDQFPNDSSPFMENGQKNRIYPINNLNMKNSIYNNVDKNPNNDKLKDQIMIAFEKNSAHNLLTLGRNTVNNDANTYKVKFNSNTNSNVNNNQRAINEINNFYLNQKITQEENQKPHNLSFLDDCTLDDQEEEYEIKSNQSSDSFGNQNTKLIEQNLNKEPNKINMPCIFKVGDDLRQDSLALQVIQIFREIFKQSGLNIYTYPYQTISTISPKYNDLGGYIEVVKDADSRDQIGKTYDSNLYDYYLCSFGQENSNEFREARKNLIESTAAYAIISYILQIKDRHNGNILVDKKGHLIHIDFGFIFDISPAGNMKFEKAEFKLTKEMIQIMGGNTSEAYKTFVDLTVKAFLACRDNMNKLLDPVVLMFSSGLDCFRDNSIKHFIDRFKLELSEEEAVKYMKNIIQTAEDNWRTNMYDFIQKKQNNIYY